MLVSIIKCFNGSEDMAMARSGEKYEEMASEPGNGGVRNRQTIRRDSRYGYAQMA